MASSLKFFTLYIKNIIKNNSFLTVFGRFVRKIFDLDLMQKQASVKLLGPQTNNSWTSGQPVVQLWKYNFKAFQVEIDLSRNMKRLVYCRYGKQSLYKYMYF